MPISLHGTNSPSHQGPAHSEIHAGQVKSSTAKSSECPRPRAASTSRPTAPSSRYSSRRAFSIEDGAQLQGPHEIDPTNPKPPPLAERLSLHRTYVGLLDERRSLLPSRVMERGRFSSFPNLKGFEPVGGATHTRSHPRPPLATGNLRDRSPIASRRNVECTLRFRSGSKCRMRRIGASTPAIPRCTDAPAA